MSDNIKSDQWNIKDPLSLDETRLELIKTLEDFKTTVRTLEKQNEEIAQLKQLMTAYKLESGDYKEALQKIKAKADLDPEIFKNYVMGMVKNV